MRRWLTLTVAPVIVVTAAACAASPAGPHRPGPARAAARATAGARGSASAAPPAIEVAAAANWWRATTDRASSCGPAALLRQAGRVERLGDCAGLLLIPPATVTVTTGQRLDLHMSDGFSLPRSSDPAALAQVTVSPDGWTGTYRALSPGRVTLISARSECTGLAIRNEVTSNCPVLSVTVLPH
jgi:hypothetical protein